MAGSVWLVAILYCEVVFGLFVATLTEHFLDWLTVLRLVESA
jgi:hypothetical protein